MTDTGAVAALARWAVLIPLLGAALVPLAALSGARLRGAVIALAAGATAVLSLLLLPAIRPGTVYLGDWVPGLVPIVVFTDGLSVFLALIAGVLGAVIVLYSAGYMAGEADQSRYYGFLVLFIGGMVGLALSANLLLLYVFWEIVGLCSYALIGFAYREHKAARAGLKALLTTRIGDAGLLVGILTLYFATTPHTFVWPEIAGRVAAGQVSPAALALAGFGFLLAAVAKSAQLPLHVWLPDAMEAPTPISALIHAATMVNAGVYLVARTAPVFTAVPGWLDTVLWVGVITAFLTAALALVEPDLKRLLAYSTISQLGFMFMAVGLGAIAASQLHLVSHALFKALLFLGAGAVIHRFHTRLMSEMGGLGRVMPWTGRTFLVGCLALAGVPVFNGFWTKDLILAAAWDQGRALALFVAGLAAALTAAYAFRAYYLVFCGEPRRAGEEAPWVMTVPLSLLALGATVSWLGTGVQTRHLAAAGLAHEVLGPAELVAHTLHSPAVLVALAALAAGGWAVWCWRDPGAVLVRVAPDLGVMLRAGYGFDGLINRLLAAGEALGLAAGRRLEPSLGVRLQDLVAGGFGKAAGGLRLAQTGDLADNTVSALVGLTLILILLLWWL